VHTRAQARASVCGLALEIFVYLFVVLFFVVVVFKKKNFLPS